MIHVVDLDGARNGRPMQAALVAEIAATVATGGGEASKPLERVDTPGKTTVEAVAAFLGVPPQALVKTLLYQADGRVVGVLVRGDRQVNEAKLAKHLATTALRLADRGTVERLTGGPEGFSGPIGLRGVELLADHEVRAMHHFVVGANVADAEFTVGEWDDCIRGST